ncbi:hypothetical protein JKP88DRAFT_280218 [Tribonema minus]|uniref:Uncharacterized protein n=1 Tax=Tribonema minus TaxID=303371 RepID=A0A836CCY4_9STRA|nr:hypothetical protein JKP88DRAFT_280218 [Tribonema minus]
MSEDEGRSSAPPTPPRETDEVEEEFEGNKSPQENLNEPEPETEKHSEGESSGETEPQLTAAHVKYNALVALVASTRDGIINRQQRKQEEEACQRELVKQLAADHETERRLLRLAKPDTSERVACQANLTALTHDSVLAEGALKQASVDLHALSMRADAISTASREINTIFDMDVSDSEKMRRLEQYANGKLKEHLREGRMVFAPGPLSLGSTAPTTEDTTVGSKVGSDSEDSGKAAPKKKAIANGGSDQSGHRDLTLSKIASVAGLSSTPGMCSVQLDALVSEVAEFDDKGQRFALKSAIRGSRDKTLINTVNFLTRMSNGRITTYGQLPFAEQVAAIKDHFDSDIARESAHNDINHAVRLPHETPQKLALRVRRLCTATGTEVEGEAEKMHFLRLLTSQERGQLTFRFGQGWRRRSIQQLSTAASVEWAPAAPAGPRARAGAKSAAASGAMSDASEASLSDEEQEGGSASAGGKSLAAREMKVAARERRVAKQAAKLEAKEKTSTAAATIAAAAVMAAAPPRPAMPPPYARPQRPDWQCYQCRRMFPGTVMPHVHKASQACLDACAAAQANSKPTAPSGSYYGPGAAQHRNGGAPSHRGPPALPARAPAPAPPAAAAAAAPTGGSDEKSFSAFIEYRRWLDQQDYANGLGVEGEAAQVTVHAAKLIVRAKLRCCVLENVVAMLSSKAWAQAEAVLLAHGYSLQPHYQRALMEVNTSFREPLMKWRAEKG